MPYVVEVEVFDTQAMHSPRTTQNCYNSLHLANSASPSDSSFGLQDMVASARESPPIEIVEGCKSLIGSNCSSSFATVP